MRYENPQIRYIARRIPILCALYFVVFSFLFFLLQRDVMVQAHILMAGELVTPYPLFVATFCTAILLPVGLLLNHFLRWLPLRQKAAVWFLPFLLVGLLTHWRFPQYGDSHSSISWWAVALLVLGYLLWILLARAFPDSFKERGTFSSYAWPNALLLILMTMMTVGVSNTDVVLHRTLRSARLVSEGQYDAALQNARWERHPSFQLSVLTTLSLSEAGQLGDRLFAFPQPHGVRGLLPLVNDTLLLGNLPRAVGLHLGYKCGERTDPLFFLQVADTMPKARPVLRDYLLCAYLIERRLDDFASRLLHDDSLRLSLPLHYREALVLRQTLHSVDTTTVLHDDSLALQYLTFDSLRTAPGTKAEREFRCRRSFGASYWCYYFFR